MAIIRHLLVLISLVLTVAPEPALAQADAERFLRRGVFVDGQIWLLTDRGTLFRIDERTKRRTDENLPEEVLDICRRDGELLAVTGFRDRGAFIVRRRSRGVWRVVGRVGRSEDGLGAMDCAPGAPVTLLTTSRLIEIGPGAPRVVPLSELVHAQVRLTTFGTAGHVFVGLNSGEWGGGLIRVDRGTGTISRIERSATADTCHGGPLNTNCDPVHAIVPIPWRPGCVAVAIGLVHFMSHGRLAEICEERVESLYSKEIPVSVGNGRTAMTSAAFFGIARSGDALVAVGVDGIYRIGPGGLLDFAPFPAFREIRGVQLSLDRPDVILAVTRINQRASVSGGAPLILPR